MAINLNPGADPSLVASAYRAGAATAPQDYFRQFESVSRNYAVTMAATANMWTSIAKAGAQVAIAIDKSNRLEAQKSDQIEDMFGTDGAKDIFAKLEGFKGAMKRTTGIWKDDRETIIEDGVEIDNPNKGKRVNPFSKETRDNRRKIQKEMNDYYASLEKMGTDVNALTTAHANKLIDEKQTPLFAMEWSNAIIQSKNGKSTDNGNRVVLEENEDGDWAFVMYHDPKKITEDATSTEGVPGFTLGKASIDEKGRLLGADGEVARYSAAEINDLLIPKDEDKNGNSRMQTGIEGFYDGIYQSGNGQDLLPHQVNEIASFVDKIKDSPKAWKTRNKYAGGGKSFFEEMTTPSVASAEAFGQLSNLEIVEENVKALEGLDGEQKAELFKGITDVPGTSKEINSEDFIGKTQQHADNYKALTLALFNPSHGNYDAIITGEVYKQNEMNRVNTLRATSWDLNPKNPAGSKFIPETSDLSLLKGTGGIKINDELTMQKSALNNIATQMHGNGGDFRGKIDLGTEDKRFIWDKTKQTYIREVDGAVIANKASLFATMFGEGFDPTQIAGLYQSIADWDGSEHFNESFDKREKKKKGLGKRILEVFTGEPE